MGRVTQTRTPGFTGNGNNNGRQPGPTGGGSKAPPHPGADARLLLRSALPEVLKVLGAGQLAQIQRIFDGTITNPEYQKQAAGLRRRGTNNYGSFVVQNEDMMRRARRIEQKLVDVSEAASRIKLDFKTLLADDALTPRTDNPDEAKYFAKVRATLESRGVYLHFQQKMVRDPDDPSRWILDPRQFDFWLSLGPGDNGTGGIPTKDGKITRESLLGTNVIGAGYQEQVNQGPVRQGLDRAVATLRSQLSTAETLWDMERKARDEAAPGVVPISDALGGASFPSRTIFDRPHALIVKALEANVGGNVMKSMVYLLAAAYKLRDAAEALDDYINATVKGAGRAVGVLKVLKGAGEVAGVILTVVGIGSFIRGAGAAVEATAVDAAAEKFASDYIAKTPGLAAELKDVRWIKGPKGTVSGGVKPGTSSGAGQGFNRGW